jgi:hypothetical protein
MKSNMPDAVLRKGNLPKPEVVVKAKENIGAAARAIAQQLTSDQIPGTNSSPKRRTEAVWGISE